jgi:hypothetical protein
MWRGARSPGETTSLAVALVPVDERTRDLLPKNPIPESEVALLTGTIKDILL